MPGKCSVILVRSPKARPKLRGKGNRNQRFFFHKIIGTRLSEDSEDEGREGVKQQMKAHGWEPIGK